MSANPLDSAIARLEDDAAFLRQVRDRLAQNPSLMPLLRDALAIAGNGVHSDSTTFQLSANTAAGTLFDRVAKRFAQLSNAWQTTPEIRQALGVTRGAIGSVLYQTHKDRFEMRDHPHSRKLKQFRLKGGGE